MALLATALLAASASALAAEPTWLVGGVRYVFDPGCRMLRASCGGSEARVAGPIGPLVGTGAEGARLESRGADGTFRYAAAGGAFALRVSATGDGVAVRVSTSTAWADRVAAGRAEGRGEWFRISYTRHAEAYGQPWWPRVAWWPELGLFAVATWRMDGSRGTSWDAPDARFRGAGPFDAGLTVAYAARTDGTRLPVDETLEVRVARDLWRAAPPPPQRPSPLARELSEMALVDIWGGRAAEAEAMLRRLHSLTGGLSRFLTIFEDWQSGGFDSLLPDSIRMPDYPPNPGLGSVAEFARLSATARRLGRFGLRTNYMYLREASPSFRAGAARFALEANGKRKWHTRPADWLSLARRQEAEIRRLFAPDASFTDQLTSGAAPWGYTDYDGRLRDGGAMGASLRAQRELAALIRRTHAGPLGSETLIDEQLLGPWIDTGDYGVYDGFHRAVTPEFKLRRWHGLSTFHGMGLTYRYFENPPFPIWSAGKATYASDPEQFDDYRASTVLFGNGPYLFYYPGMSWSHMMTEVLVVGAVARRAALAPVRRTLYWRDGRWRTLLDLVRAGIDPQPLPWTPRNPSMLRIRIEYANGLTVVVNRLPDEFRVAAAGTPVRLPKAGWVAWTADGGMVACSAILPGQAQRVDYVRDDARQMRYVDPRGGRAMGAVRPTLWIGGREAVSLDAASGDAVIRGRMTVWRPPTVRRVRTVRFRFDRGTCGWVGQSHLGPLVARGGRLCAAITGDDPYLAAPPLDLAPDSVRTLVIRMRVSCGTFGQLYFEADGAGGGAEDRCIHFPVEAGQMREIRIPVGEHPLWRGRRITSLRLDPEHGASPGQIEIESITGE